eukprot:m.361372 g.361372  ORF g.361372 m.361372 type:complete len:181 (+) comp19535_c0_seq1:107-649(+)
MRLASFVAVQALYCLLLASLCAARNRHQEQDECFDESLFDNDEVTNHTVTAISIVLGALTLGGIGILLYMSLRHTKTGAFFASVTSKNFMVTLERKRRYRSLDGDEMDSDEEHEAMVETAVSRAVDAFRSNIGPARSKPASDVAATSSATEPPLAQPTIDKGTSAGESSASTPIQVDTSA